MCFLRLGLPARAAQGGKHMCAILNDGGVKCWGKNVHSVLGTAYSEDYDVGAHSNDMGDSLPRIDLGTGLKALEVVCGWRLQAAQEGPSIQKQHGD